MLESFIITLREGVEAALVVCLALTYLRKIGRPDLGRSVWLGVGLASVLAIAAGVWVNVKHFETEGKVEGIVLLVSSAMVAWLVLWMRRHGKTVKETTEKRLGALAAGSKAGVFLFAFLMVFREGAETVLMLLGAGLTTEGMLAGAGAAAGLVLAIALGVAFYRGTLRVDLRKFFSVTTVILLLFAVQLFASGLHEFAEAGILPSGETYMRVIGPLMKHSTLFVIAVLVLPFLLMLRRAVQAAAVPPPVNPAEERKELARSRGERIAKGVFALLGVAVILALGVAWAQESRSMVLSAPEIVFDPAPELLVPVERVADGKLHRFAVPAEGKLLRFLILKKREKEEYVGVMDACAICFDKGYAQVGESFRCLNCAAEINAPTLGEEGGCNPIPIVIDARRSPEERSILERRGESLVVPLDRVLVHASFFKWADRVEMTCAGCGMKFPAGQEAGMRDGKPYCRMPSCQKKLEGK
jgi:FTR1 family protein